MRELTEKYQRLLEAADTFSGVVVTVEPRMEERVQLAQTREGDEPIERLHLTLAYMGDMDDLTRIQIESVHAAAAAIAESHGPLSGTVSGIGHFANPGHECWVALANVPFLSKMREALVQELERREVPVSHQHGFCPHITLSYQAEAKIPPGIPLHFGDISVRVGPHKMDYPLIGQPGS